MLKLHLKHSLMFEYLKFQVRQLNSNLQDGFVRLTSASEGRGRHSLELRKLVHRHQDRQQQQQQQLRPPLCFELRHSERLKLLRSRSSAALCRQKV